MTSPPDPERGRVGSLSDNGHQGTENPFRETDSVVPEHLYSSFITGTGPDDLGLEANKSGDFDRYFDHLGSIAKPTIGFVKPTGGRRFFQRG